MRSIFLVPEQYCQLGFSGYSWLRKKGVIHFHYNFLLQISCGSLEELEELKKRLKWRRKMKGSTNHPCIPTPETKLLLFMEGHQPNIYIKFLGYRWIQHWWDLSAKRKPGKKSGLIYCTENRIKVVIVAESYSSWNDSVVQLLASSYVDLIWYKKYSL